MHKYRYFNTVKLGLFDKSIIILTFICFIATVTFSLMSYYKARENQINLVESSLEQYSNDSKNSIEEYFESKFQILELLASYPEVYTMDLQKQYDFFKSREMILSFNHFIIMDTNGMGYYVNSNYIKDQSQERFFIDVMNNERFLTDPFIEKNNKTSIITLSVSLYNNNEKVGALCGVIDLDNINSLFENKSYSDSGYGFLIDKDGYYVSHENMEYVYNEKNVFESSENLTNNINFFRTAIDNDKAMIDEVVLDGKSYYAGFNPLDLKRWYVVFLINKDYALNSLNSFVIFQILAVTFGILLLFLGVRILYRAIENHKLAYTDSLTNINNRAAFNKLCNELEKNYKNKVIIVCFDLNNFKYINDTYGHKLGDELLSAFAAILKKTFGNIGFICRMGGDEFIAILVNEDYAELINNIEKMIKLIKESNKNSKYKIEVSYGYSIREKEDSTPLINIHEEADKNMYVFKNTYKRK